MRYLNTTILAFLLIVIAMNIMPVPVNAQSSTAKKNIPGTFPKNKVINSASESGVGLQQFYSSTGHYTLSADGIGSLSSAMKIRVNKPNASATVQKAVLISSVTYGTINDGCVTLDGTSIKWDGSATSTSGFSFHNYWADVTSLVAKKINGLPAGISTLDITECSTGSIEGEALLVVFKDAAATEKTIVIMLGAQNPSGDNFSVTLAQPIDPKKAGALLDMGLGIGYSYQTNGSNQASQISVNDKRLTSSAGGEDDGYPANGGLITVGGIGDKDNNPADPMANPTNPRSDDELYSILPFITKTTTSLNINTINPSLDDNIFLAYFALSGAAIIGEGILLSQTQTSGNVGTKHTVIATVVNSLGDPITNRTVTFTVTSGPNTGNKYSTKTNSKGEASYTYTGSGGSGTDNIEACFTNNESEKICSNTLSFEWMNASNVYYSKSSGDLHKIATWGVNTDGSGTNPTDFGAGKTFVLANRTVNYNMTADWIIGGEIVNNAGNKLNINGYTLTEAGISGTGTISGSNTSNLIVTGSSGAGILNFTPAANALKNFTIRNNASAGLGNALNVYGMLNVQSGQLTTSGNLTLKSTSSTTAIVAPVMGTISGAATVERFIPARRAWRLINSPVMGSQTINQAWQEGATTESANPNPHPGYGTHITGGNKYGTLTNGFDQHKGSNSSLLWYNNATDEWLPAHNTNATTVGNKPYMLFIRGDRSLVLDGPTLKPNNTVLRSKGSLLTGNQTYAVNAKGFTAITNPYQSPVDFATIARSHVKNSFYVWDPKLGGTYGVGAFVTVSWNGSSYDVTPSVSDESQYIQPWQSFMVESTGGMSGILTIKESDKTATPLNNVYRSSDKASIASLESPRLRVNLQSVETDNTTALLDEVFTSYNVKFSNDIDEWDAGKVFNLNENLSLVRSGHDLAIERRQLIEDADTIQLQLSNTVQKNYLLQFTPSDFSNEFVAYLEDKYLHTVMPVSLTEVTKLSFSVNAEPASQRSDRFMIVLSSSKHIPLAGRNTITVYPNPTNGKTIHLNFTDLPKGKYFVRIANSTGQIVFETEIVHEGGSTVHTLQLNKQLGRGIYQLQFDNNKNTRKNVKLFIN